MIFSYWAYLGIIYLIILTYQDYKNKRMVDDRFNFFMMGVSISLYSHTRNTIGYQLALIVILTGLYAFLRKFKPMGEADINTITWAFLGFGIISPFHLLAFVIIFIILTMLYYTIKMLLAWILRLDYKQPTQFYGTILLTYILACVILELL